MKIPYQKQLDVPGNRMCGAAALCMVYDSFGIKTSQQDVWPRISVLDKEGEDKYSMTYLLCADAIKQSLHGIIIQAKNPWKILKLCNENSIRAILLHRLEADSPCGHFTVLVDVDDQFVTLNDPEKGPNRKVERNEMLDLWSKKGKNCEIEDNILIAISKNDSGKASCPLCGTVIPRSTRCTDSNCNTDILLQPFAVLGCIKNSCPERTWEYIDCPHCDESLEDIP